MRYLMLIKHSEDVRNQPIPQGLLEAMGEFVGEGFKSGLIKDTAGLKPSAQGFRVRTSGGKLSTTDGPFTEAKELVGGFAIVEVKSEEQAREVAHRFMELHRVHWPEFVGECEVRPFEDME
ncbi:MAG TPA: YciI family protein [Longimicrobiales bacterium]